MRKNQQNKNKIIWKRRTTYCVLFQNSNIDIKRQIDEIE